MYIVRYGGKGGKPYRLRVSAELVAVRTHRREPLERTPLSREARRLVSRLEVVARFPDAGVEVLRADAAATRHDLRDKVRAALKKEPECRFAGRTLEDPAGRVPVVYTENFFVKFRDDVAPGACKKTLEQRGLIIKRELDLARNAFFAAAPEGTGLEVFEIAERLLADATVELCHPELVRQVRRRQAFPQQWHLKKTQVGAREIDAHAHVEDAWELSEGEGTTIAVIDDGIDIDHQEFAGAGKILAPRDVTLGTGNPRPGSGDNHGTACAGVACAAGRHGASGVAPRARLIPVRLASGLGSQAEADAFLWAARNGADVISCSWGPQDGDWSDPTDPTHQAVVPLPDSTRLAIDWAITNGREGKGCVIFFAAGNGNESVENDGYASYSRVIAVAASNDSGRRSAYSDLGKAVWCAFPSNDVVPARTPGIWTTDRSGPSGYNPGQSSRGDVEGHYTNSFGGTSSACPGAAGVAALVLARNPSLRWDEVKDVIRRSCDKIDAAGGKYDSSGHSRLYGHGRVNARKAVELAAGTPAGTPAAAARALSTAVHTLLREVPIRDAETARATVEVGDRKPILAVRIAVDLQHTAMGELVIRVIPPAAMRSRPVVLHDGSGGDSRGLQKTFDERNTPDLARLSGKRPAGTWRLEVRDTKKRHTGKIRSFTVELDL